MENVAPFIPLELCEKDQKKMEDYFLARSSLPFKSLEMSGGGADMTLQAKITGALEISNGSIQALAPIICTASELPSPLHGSCVIDGVLNYCKRLSFIKSQHQLSKTFTKSIGKCLKNQLGETFQVSPNPVRCEAKKDVTEVSPSGQNPLFCSTPAGGSVPTIATPESNAYEECITTTAQQSQVILTGNKETTFNSSMLIRSRRSMHRQETFRHTMGKENLKPLIEESDSNKRTPRSAFVCPKNSENVLQKNAKQEGLLLQFPPMANTPKGRMSFQISGSVEWEN